ncbi:hypothetical protein DER45DRAFT_577759 [Fusarium avenaceum]|nr:hypothetical protein DER45DRAFT_577759 [Fusarium avenaceum]
MALDCDHDVSLLMRESSRASIDRSHREKNHRHSLLLDKVMQGRLRTSSSRLIQLPAEILSDIVDLLSDDKPTLASLALVNSDCRQLARCCQFAEVHFDYSLRIHQLIAELANEPSLHLSQPGIAACIRTVTFASRPRYVQEIHRQLYESVYGHEKESVTRERRDVLRREGNTHYTLLRAVAVQAISELPNLETLILRDGFSLDKECIERITRCAAQHIVLDGTAIDASWSLRPPLTPPTWPIRSLCLNIQLAFAKVREHHQGGNGVTHPLTNFFSTLFQLCSPTLETLSWSYMEFTRNYSIPVSIGNIITIFPRLRHLQLASIKLDEIAISSFFASPLKSLDLTGEILASAGTLRCEPFRDLESLVVPDLPREASACKRIAEFMTCHNGIRRLYIHEHDESFGNSAHLDRYILPALNSPDWNNLQSLSLAWGLSTVGQLPNIHYKAQVPVAALEVIGRIVSLEQLSLCSGHRSGRQHQWAVNHNELYHHFSRLKGLKRLALVRDTYLIPGDEMNFEQYYELRLVTAQEKIDAHARPELDGNDKTKMEDINEEDDPQKQIWERAHRNRMLEQAEKYAIILPKLEWIFCGQRQMSFTKAHEGITQPRIAVPLTQGRDECCKHIESSFRKWDSYS